MNRERIRQKLVSIWRTESVYIIILTLCFLLPILAHAYVGSYSRMMADDYCSAGVALRFKNVFAAAWSLYMGWSGRFSANVADCAAGLLGPQIPSYLPAAILTLWLLALTGALFQLMSKYRLFQRLALAVLGASAILQHAAILPTVAQSLYWGQGMRSVVPPLVLLTLYMGIVAQQATRPGFAHLAAGAILTLIAGGFSETFVVLQTGLLAAMLFFFWKILPGHARRVLIAGLVGSLLALCIVALAPGNQIRQANAPAPPSLDGMIRIALYSLIEFAKITLLGRRPFTLLTVIRQLGHLVAAPVLGCLAGAGWVVSEPLSAPLSRKTLGLVLLGLPVLTGLIVASCFFPAAYALSAGIPLRTFVIPQFVLVCALSAWGYTVGCLIKSVRWPRWLNSSLPKIILASIIILAAANAIWTAYQTLQSRPAFSAYAQAWDENHHLIQEARSKGDHEIFIRSLHNPAGLDEVTADPNFWMSRCVHNYYGMTVLADPQQ